ncbi:MAG: 2'-5' RNA ligase family protein [Chthoniobacterales bacterium]|nr:2'-5' RNA ligase family protein [Chthoniobacterales bacterium]MBA3762456.1 2'-5' RNA ligase family protein [Chthoniobacterales bacterium]
MPGEETIAFWLLPAAGARETLAALIAQLAERCDAPTFEPHVTLAGGELGPPRANQILQTISAREPIELEIERIDFSEQYTKTLFLQFRSVPEIESLAAEIRRLCGGEDEFNPHSSLLYKEMPAAEKAELARTIKVPFQQVRFDAVKTIQTPHPIHAREQVEAWRTLGWRQLKSSGG